MEGLFPAYEGMEPFVFVCYAHDDAASVYPELVRLRDAGFNIWHDEGISPGADWSEAVAGHIQRSSVFLFFVTPRSVDCEHCRREVDFALEEGRTVLPVHLEPTSVPPALKLSLSHHQAIFSYEHPTRTYQARLDRALEAAALGRSERVETPQVLQIGDWRLDVASSRLLRADEERVLEPKDLSVLLQLAEASPDVVSAEALLAGSWSGIVVGDNVLHQAIGRLRRAFGDNARKPRYIETLARRGYRLMLTARPVAHRPAPLRAAETRKAARLAIVPLAVVAACVVGFLLWASNDDQVAPPYSVAVLPFDHTGEGSASGNGIGRALSRGVASELARVQTLEVLADEVLKSDRSGIGYLVMGDWRVQGPMVEVSARLVSRAGNEVLWSATYRFARDELFDAKLGVAAKIAYEARSWLGRDQLKHLLAVYDPDPYALDLVIRASDQYTRMVNGHGGNWNVIHRMYEAAAQLDPDFWFPLVLQINSMLRKQLEGSATERKAKLEELLDRCYQLAATSADLQQQCRLQHAQVLIWSEFSIGPARKLLLQALEYDPEVYIGHWVLGHAYLMEGNDRAALASFRSAEQVDHREERVLFQADTCLLYWLIKARADARRSCEEGLRYASSNGMRALFLRQLARLDLEMQDVDSASARLDTAWQLQGEREAHLFADIFSALGEVERADAALNGWLSNGAPLVPGPTEDPLVIESLQVLLAAGQNQLAIEYLTRSLELRLNHALVAAMTGRLRSALQHQSTFARVSAALASMGAFEREPQEPETGRLATTQSIVVIPFDDLSSREADAYLADGLSVELMTMLDRVPGLRVAPQTSSFYYQRNRVPLAEIGEQLKVSLVLEGSIRNENGKLRVTAGLVRISDGETLWLEVLERPAGELLVLQRELATAIVDALAPQLSASEPQAPADVGTLSNEAFDLFLRARNLTRQDNAGDFAKAEQLFEAALQADPGFLRAYQGLAEVTVRKPFRDGGDFAGAFRDWTAIKERVGRLDNPDSETMARFEFFNRYFARNYSAAEAVAHQQLALRPDDVEWLDRYAMLLKNGGVFMAALEYMRRLNELDPFNPNHVEHVGDMLLALDRPQEALAAYERCLKLAPRRVGCKGQMQITLSHLGRTTEVEDRWPDMAPIQRCMLLKQLSACDSDADGLLPWARALMAATLGDREDFYRWLNFAADQPYGFVDQMRWQHLHYDVLEQGAERDRLLARLNLTDEWKGELCRRARRLVTSTGIAVTCTAS